MQTQPGKYNGAVDCTRKVLKTHGPKGLFKGMATPLATVAVFNAVLFATRGQMENVLAHADGVSGCRAINPLTHPHQAPP